MDALDISLSLVLRWLHVLSAVTLVGGAVMARAAVLPAADGLPDAQRQDFHAQVRRRWSKVVMAGIALLLITGLVNFLRVNGGLKDFPQFNKPLYHALFGAKFLLALLVFLVASALVGRSNAFQTFRQNARTWLSVNIALAVLVICLSGVMRVLRDDAARPQPPRTPPTTQTAT